MRSHCGGHNKDMVNTLILIDIMISAMICHPLPTTHDLPPGAWRLQLCKSLDQIPRSIYISKMQISSKATCKPPRHCPRAKSQWSGPPYWTTPPQPRAPHNAGQERKKPKLEQGSGCGGQMDRAQTMAGWEPHQSATTEINGGFAAVFWALNVWRSSTLNCRRSVSRLTWQSRREKHCRYRE